MRRLRFLDERLLRTGLCYNYHDSRLTADSAERCVNVENHAELKNSGIVPKNKEKEDTGR